MLKLARSIQYDANVTQHSFHYVLRPSAYPLVQEQEGYSCAQERRGGLSNEQILGTITRQNGRQDVLARAGAHFPHPFLNMKNILHCAAFGLIFYCRYRFTCHAPLRGRMQILQVDNHNESNLVWVSCILRCT